MIENGHFDIFTEVDDSIFIDGSIDPMGLRILWTSLGSKIFGNKLNTISNDIRLYTINLFHHWVIYSLEKKIPEKIHKIIGTEAYPGRTDFREGVVIFLECLLVQSVHKLKPQLTQNSQSSIPGTSKLQTLINNKDIHATQLEVNKYSGILIRHLQLGIHGRHKGPFIQMDIFGNKDYYFNQSLWEQIDVLFNSIPQWRNLKMELTESILTPIFDQKITQKKYYSINIDNTPISNILLKKYAQILSPENFKQELIVHFWEDRLGLNTGPAGNLYDRLKDYILNEKTLIWENIIRDTLDNWDGIGREKVEAIVAIEPFLALIGKVSNKLLDKRTYSTNDKETVEFINYKIKTVNVNVSEIKTYCDKSFYDQEGLNRIVALVSIYDQQLRKPEATVFAESLIDYHSKLMRARGSLPWVSIDSNHTIKHHRSLYFNEKQLLDLSNNNWVNNYYLTTLFNLYKGLHLSHEDI